MKKNISTSVVAFCLLYTTASCFAQWQRTNGPEGGGISFLGKNDSTIFAGTLMGGIYSSKDLGSSWSCGRTGLGNAQVNSILINGSNIFVGTEGGIYLSTDNGSNWSARNTGLTNYSIHSFAAKGDTIFAGTWTGIHISTNSGASWRLLNGINYPVGGIVISGSDIFAGTINGGGVFFSTDWGETWTQRNTGLTNLFVYKLAKKGDNIYAATEKGLFLSTNNGISWNAISPGYSVVVLTLDGDNIFTVIRGEGIRLSTDNGQNWTSLNNGLGPWVSSILVCENNIFAGNGEALYKSSDYGNSWTTAINGLYATSVRSMAVKDEFVFAGTDMAGFGIYSSTDNGIHWTIANTGLTSHRITDIITNETSVFVSTSGGGVFLSEDNGANWKCIGLTNTSVGSLALNGTDLYAGTNDGLFLSSDNGENWTYLGLADTDRDIACVAILGSKIFVGTVNGIYFSDNNGADWNAINNGLTNTYITSLSVNGTSIFATTAGGIFSSDDGANWCKMGFGGWTYSLFFDRSDIYAATSNGVYKYNGTVWDWFNTGIDNFQVFAYALSGNNLFAGTYGGSVWRRQITRAPGFAIEGKVTDNEEHPVKGVLMYGLPCNPVTDSNGVYIDTVSQGWSGTVIPVKKAYSFDPVSKYYSNVQLNFNSQDYLGTCSSLPSICVTPDSLIIIQSEVLSTKEPSYTYVDNSVNNPVDPNVLPKPYSSEHPMGSLVPDSVVWYWENRKVKVPEKSKVFPSVIDWSNNDSPVKDQGSCGSCWAFAATAFIENQGSRDDLSEQVVVSCSGAGGCGGGYFDQALLFFKNTGVPDESCYPYTQTDGVCSEMCSAPSYKEKITHVSNTLWGITTPENLKEELQNGPLVVRMLVPDDNTFNGSPGYQSGIYNYNGGIISESRGHAVLLVGYNDNQQCFKAKNSWGTIWGENGYFRIAYDDVTDDVHFGSYAVNGSGVYTDPASFASFAISNTGNDDLIISLISDNQDWLSVDSNYLKLFSISPSEIRDISVSVDWSLTGFSEKTGIITIESNDPIKPSVLVKVTAIPLPCNINAPSIGPITQPTCNIETGSVFLYDLPVTGTWTLTQLTDEITYSGIGTSTTISELAPNTYTFSVTNASGCTSDESAPVVINVQPITPASPSMGTVTQPTCTVETGSVFLDNLPAKGTWTLTQLPGEITCSGTGTSTTVSDLFPGTYIFLVTNASGCTSEVSAPVVINAQPLTPTSPSIGPITQLTCTIETGCVFLYDLPATGTWTLTQLPDEITYSGKGTSITISDLSPGTYTFSVINASGCTSDISAIVVINIQPQLPTPVITLLNGTVLHSDATDGNQWYNQKGLIEGAIYQDYTPIENGDYFTIVTLSDCFSDTSNLIHFTLTRIQSIGADNFIRIYPNPVLNELNIEIENNIEKIDFEILNSIGQTVYSNSLIDKAVVKTNNFLPGIYLIKLEVKRKIIFKKLIKE